MRFGMMGVAAAALLMAASASAAPITYTYTTTLGGSTATFTGIGDTTMPSNFFVGFKGIAEYALTSFTLQTTQLYTFTQPWVFFSNQNGTVGFSTASATGFNIGSPSLIGYNAATNVAPTAVTAGYADQIYFPTDRGEISIYFVGPGTFTATTSASNPGTGPGTDPTTSPAVPEPATWAMMILGFGLAGLGLRRKPTATMRFA